ncbi:beta-lactamase-like protein [Mycena rebaudengoi]|nr:beta-lactamase-like protein [Mycena rebaudengoi]
MPTFRDLGIPASAAIVTLKAFDVAADPNRTSLPASAFLQPVLPGHENLSCPIYAFLVEHGTGATAQRIMFDLGVRKDLENLAPRLAAVFKSGIAAMPVDKDIVEQLTAGDISLETIETVIWSHSHFDHIGDMSKFPPTTTLVFGQGTERLERDPYTVNPKSTLLESDMAGRRLMEVDFDKSDFIIGGMKAHDFFGDGSFYLLDAPGHAPGHMCALARVTPTDFVLLGADTCHHPGQFRPTEKLHRNLPCPGELLAAARHSISTEQFSPENSSSGFDLAARTTPLLDIADVKHSVHDDPPLSRVTISKISDFDANPDVFVLLAHDMSLVSVIDLFPAQLNEWKEKGWKQKGTWAFVDEKNPAFRFKAKTAA